MTSLPHMRESCSCEKTNVTTLSLSPNMLNMHCCHVGSTIVGTRLEVLQGQLALSSQRCLIEQV